VTTAEIAASLGRAHRSGAWWRCRCPVHQSHGPTLALRDGNRGGLIAVCHAGCVRADILAELRRRGLIGGSDRGRPVPVTVRSDDREDAARRLALARRLWDTAQDARRSPVVAYLAGRGIKQPLPPSLRWAPACRHPSGIHLPAMVGKVVDVGGALIGLHRTFLRPDGSGKAAIEPQKALLGPVGGGAVRLAPAGEILLIGEGIESCMAALQATAMPTWAALSTSGMPALILPPFVRTIIILADHDRSGAGERAAYAAAHRQLAEGRRVRIALPPEPDTDFNDVLLGKADWRIAELCDVAA
jgi:putative DNA primase/helicase